MTKCGWSLTFGGKYNPENYVSIYNTKNNMGNSFTGVIKNKSELKKLMKQIGI